MAKRDSEYGRKQVAAWRAKHPEYLEKARQAAKKWRKENKERAAANKRAWYLRYREREREKRRAIRKADPDKARAAGRRNYQKHRARALAYGKRWWHANKARLVEANYLRHLKRTYGITAEQYEALGKRCHVCGAAKSEGKRPRLQVDHCHDTNLIRGLLCQGCNVGLGNFKHDKALLRKAIAYLGRH